MSHVGPSAEGRSNRLSRALWRIGLRPTHRVVVLCCEEHEKDALAARLAVEKVGAAVLVPDLRDPADLEARLDGESVRYVLACREGAEVWQGCSSPAVLVSDVPGGYWWRAIENCESDEPVSFPPASVTSCSVR